MKAGPVTELDPIGLFPFHDDNVTVAELGADEFQRLVQIHDGFSNSHNRAADVLWWNWARAPGLCAPAPAPCHHPQARQTRGAVYAALGEAGVPKDRVAQVERLESTAVLGFAVSEVAGRFHGHSRRQLDSGFEALQAMLAAFIQAEAVQ